jgi:hypothetical protein
MKMEPDWHNRLHAAQADHKYVEQLLLTADAEVLEQIEKHPSFYLQSPTFLGHLLKRVYDFNESP